VDDEVWYTDEENRRVLLRVVKAMLFVSNDGRNKRRWYLNLQEPGAPADELYRHSDGEWFWQQSVAMARKGPNNPHR